MSQLFCQLVFTNHLHILFIHWHDFTLIIRLAKLPLFVMMNIWYVLGCCVNRESLCVPVMQELKLDILTVYEWTPLSVLYSTFAPFFYYDIHIFIILYNHNFVFLLYTFAFGIFNQSPDKYSVSCTKQHCTNKQCWLEHFYCILYMISVAFAAT